MTFFTCWRRFLRLSLMGLLLLFSTILNACSEGGGSHPDAGIESRTDPSANSEEETSGKQWNKMTWGSGKWG